MSADFKSHGPGSDLDASFSMEELRSFRMDDGVIYAVVGHNPKSRVISEVWLGDFKTEERLKEVVRFILEQLETNTYKYWLADLRFLVTLVGPTENWFFNTVLPRAFSLGIERFAITFPEKADMAPTILEGVGKAKAAFAREPIDGLKLFEDIDAAKKWLLTG